MQKITRPKKNGLIVGITGGLATGKSTVTSMFQRLGAQTVDADKIVHNLLAKKGPCAQKVVKIFGAKVRGTQGIDRAALAKIVFNDAQKLNKLENIIHPYVVRTIQGEIKDFRQQRKRKILAVEVPLLFEAGLNRLMDKVVVVYADKEVQLKRARQLKSLSRADALKRINAQMGMQHKIRLADFVLDNSASLPDTRRQVRDVYKRLNIQT